MNNNVQATYENIIHKTRYARWIPEENRRESWAETVNRYIDYFVSRAPEGTITPEVKNNLKNAILNKEIMPSMRAMMTAGPALDRDHVAGYNCAYLPVDHIRCFDETLYVLMCGCGVGYSVERQAINKLPVVSEDFYPSNTILKPQDSRIGWATSLRELISLLYEGRIPTWDLSLLRPQGTRLKTFGGRSSGPEPLNKLFKFCVSTFKAAAGRKLTSLEVSDIMCTIGECVVSGGVRRSALICLSNLTDERMRRAKSGEWWHENNQRSLANISVAYTEKPDISIFMTEFLNLIESKSGERGIFNRVASRNKVLENGRRDPDHEWGCNPCSEIILRPYQFCNLTEVIIRPQDTFEDVERKVIGATILGTLQSTLTDFRYLRKIWKTNCEEERLLGVSLTGIMDHQSLSNPNNTSEYSRLNVPRLKEVAIEVNGLWSDILGISPSTAITCIKPSGTVSQLCGTSSGIHPRFAKFYIRRIIHSSTDPVTKYLIEKGVPHEPQRANSSNVVFAFPLRSPATSYIVADMDAVTQLETWFAYQEDWCEHKPSCTIYVDDHEWLEVAAWVYKNFEVISGVSFFPRGRHIYEQAPYEEIDEATYNKLVEAFPKDVNVDEVLEEEDNSPGSKELACQGSACEL